MKCNWMLAVRLQSCFSLLPEWESSRVAKCCRGNERTPPPPINKYSLSRWLANLLKKSSCWLPSPHAAHLMYLPTSMAAIISLWLFLPPPVYIFLSLWPCRNDVCEHSVFRVISGAAIHDEESAQPSRFSPCCMFAGESTPRGNYANYAPTMKTQSSACLNNYSDLSKPGEGKQTAHEERGRDFLRALELKFVTGPRFLQNRWAALSLHRIQREFWDWAELQLFDA